MPAESRKGRTKKVCHPIVGWIDEDEMTPRDRDRYENFQRHLSEGMKFKDIDGKVVEDSGGMKNDKDKADWSLIPLETIEGIVDVLTYGAKKYARDNWQKVSVNRNFAALLRHLTKWQAGEEIDPESGLHHLDHALCDLMFMKWKITAR